MSEPVNNGAIPTLGASASRQILGKPTARVKSKTNVGKFIVLGMVLIAFLFIIAGLLIYQRNKSKQAGTEDTTSNPIAAAIKPTFSEKNAAIENDSIERVKAEIKKKEEDEKAQIKAIQDAEAEATKRNAGTQSAGIPPIPTWSAQSSNLGNSQQVVPRPPTPIERKLTGGVLLETTGAKPRNEAQSSNDQQQREVQSRLAAIGAGNSTPPSSGFNAGGNQGNDSISSRLQPTVLQARAAGKLSNLDFLLKKGTMIPCALKTGIDTTLPGFVMCVTLSDVYSANNKTLLIERGATVFGEQQSTLKQGQERTFVVWTRVDNPNGVYATLDSPATDQMGYSGVPGQVDNHFWQRFGGAIMLSLIRDFSQSAAQRSTGTSASGQPIYANTQNATQDMAAEALRNSINIPPTLVVNPATIVNVMVARDVSFENVYSVIK